jgi:cytochrome b561
MLKNTKNSYGLIARILHWLIGIAILCMIGVGYYMSGLSFSPYKFELYDIHKATGFLLCILIIFRLIWRIYNIQPKTVENTPYWQEAAAKLNFKVLYVLTLAMPASGILMSLYGGYEINVFGIFTIPAFVKNAKYSGLAAEFHSAFAILIIMSVSLHILGALYHHFYKKDLTLIRMIYGDTKRE